MTKESVTQSERQRKGQKKILWTPNLQIYVFFGLMFLSRAILPIFCVLCNSNKIIDLHYLTTSCWMDTLEIFPIKITVLVGNY